MRIEALWISDAVLEKIEAKHAVQESEVDEACRSDLRHVRRGRDGCYKVFSRTDAGRYLLVVLYPQREGVCAVGTAREMATSERRLYESARGWR